VIIREKKSFYKDLKSTSIIKGASYGKRMNYIPYFKTTKPQLLCGGETWKQKKLSFLMKSSQTQI
jgi:hypothetical protein